MIVFYLWFLKRFYKFRSIRNYFKVVVRVLSVGCVLGVLISGNGIRVFYKFVVEYCGKYYKY